MQFFALLRTIIVLLPMIRDAIVAVEQMLPGDGKGAQKLQMVRGFIEIAYKRAVDTADDFEVLWPALAEQVALIVAAYNAVGTFKKGKSPEEPPE